MSKTDKTKPWKFLREDECPGKCGGGYPCKHFNSAKTLKVYKDKHNGKHRTHLRVALAKGEEPEPARHRHTGLWDLA